MRKAVDYIWLPERTALDYHMAGRRREYFLKSIDYYLRGRAFAQIEKITGAFGRESEPFFRLSGTRPVLEG
jgi:hypothetical protein